MAMRTFIVCALLLGGCAAGQRALPAYYQIAPGNLQPPDTTVNIRGLSSCTDNPDHSIHLKLAQPVYVLVHG
jgi:uncharacterized lipoprotein YmbA